MATRASADCWVAVGRNPCGSDGKVSARRRSACSTTAPSKPGSSPHSFQRELSKVGCIDRYRSVNTRCSSDLVVRRSWDTKRRIAEISNSNGPGSVSRSLPADNNSAWATARSSVISPRSNQ